MLASLLPVISAAMIAAPPCDTCKNTKIGQTAVMGNGLIYSWVRLDDKKQPQAVGVTFTETALNNLPPDPMEPYIWVEWALQLPKVKGLPFDHVGVNWNPMGHIPPGIYDTPHFDFHFYTISQDARAEITAKGESRKLCSTAPGDGLMPADYIFAPQSEEPTMGGHWVDKTSPELNGNPFTTTFVFGSYAGKVIFQEPMMTLAYIQSKPNAVIDIKQTADVQTTGFYPKTYRVSFDPERREYTIALEGMTMRTASKVRRDGNRDALLSFMR
jgi:hypothetical protein